MAVASPAAHPQRTSVSRSAEGYAVAEDRKEPPFEGGSQPVVHQKDPLPGPGRSIAPVITLILCVVIAAVIGVYLLGYLR